MYVRRKIAGEETTEISKQRSPIGVVVSELRDPDTSTKKKSDMNGRKAREGGRRLPSGSNSSMKEKVVAPDFALNKETGRIISKKRKYSL